MGKRSKFDRNPRDFYPTPYKAVLPLLPHLDAHTTFAEVCVGDFALVQHLEKHGHRCMFASDIAYRADGLQVAGAEVIRTGVTLDALELTSPPLRQCDRIITNPPFDKTILFPMIYRFRELKPTWLLLNADFMHNVGSSPYLEYCSKIVSIGRVKWVEDTKHGGMENFAWYLFEQEKCSTTFHGR